MKQVSFLSPATWRETSAEPGGKRPSSWVWPMHYNQKITQPGTENTKEFMVILLSHVLATSTSSSFPCEGIKISFISSNQIGRKKEKKEGRRKEGGKEKNFISFSVWKSLTFISALRSWPDVGPFQLPHSPSSRSRSAWGGTGLNPMNRV